MVLFGACILSSLLGYVAIASISMGERPRRNWMAFKPKFWFVPAWSTFLGAVVVALVIALRS